ncbi:YqaA family protein [Lysobacter changpingensis]|uniref:YqaA family protein n=1 Tax=Lysobacter changpingensis TaxID=2792784 RepID=UPI001A8C1721|nr:YqaA family protein [Lysobacter changpingensis]
MKIFGPLYERTIGWARHRRAPAFLTGLSFAEAVVFPVPPEVMLAPMCLAQPKRGFWFATLSLLGSLAGAVVGYALGHFAYELVKPLLAALGWMERIDAQVQQLREIAAHSPWQAFWLLVLAGFTPIPLKIFTWASGIVGVPLVPFLASMFIGRGKRVYLVALAIRLGGVRAEAALRRYIEPIGWIASVLLVAAIGWLVWKAQFG